MKNPNKTNRVPVLRAWTPNNQYYPGKDVQGANYSD